MAPVGGVVVTVSLFTVSMTTVFGTDNVGFLECRTDGESKNKRDRGTKWRWVRWEINSHGGRQESKLDVTHVMKSSALIGAALLVKGLMPN